MSSTVAGELYSIAASFGYEGTAPKTAAEAIDVLADTLAGSDVTQDKTIAAAIKTIGSHIAPVPTGTKTITANGTKIDVAEYAYVTVAVE